MAQILPENQVDQLSTEHCALLDLLAVALKADVDGLILGGADQCYAAVDQRHSGIGAHGLRQVEHPLIALRENYISVRVQKERGQINHIKNARNFQGNSMVEVHFLASLLAFCPNLRSLYSALCKWSSKFWLCIGISGKFPVNL